MKKINHYWDQFYFINKEFQKPSNFAKFVKKKIINKKTKLLEIGCGDGRDSFYFFKYSKKIYSIDKSKIVIKKNIEIVNKRKIKNLFFNRININSSQFLKLKNFNLIYARFFLHAINSEEEKIFINFLKNYSKKNTLVALEFRTTKDRLLNKGIKISKYERITDHYRRFINVKDFVNKLQINKFKIIYLKEGINLSKYKDDNPHLCRIIFKL